MANCTRRKYPDKDEAGTSAEPHHHAQSETSPSPLINFLLDATKKLQDEKSDVLPVLRVYKLHFPTLTRMSYFAVVKLYSFDIILL